MRVAYIHLKWLENLLEISHPSFSLQLIGYHVRLKLCAPKRGFWGVVLFVSIVSRLFFQAFPPLDWQVYAQITSSLILLTLSFPAYLLCKSPPGGTGISITVHILINFKIRGSPMEYTKILLCSAFTLQIHYIFWKCNKRKRDINIAIVFTVVDVLLICMYVFLPCNYSHLVKEGHKIEVHPLHFPVFMTISTFSLFLLV